VDNVVLHIEALNYLWDRLGGSLAPPSGHEQCQKRFPDEDNWHWVRIADWGEDRVESPAALAWLNARWAIVERIFQEFTELRPMIRRRGDDNDPRGLEAWEWSCIGLHRLWDGWTHPDGLVRADLRPALFSFETDETPQEELVEYELFYAVERIEALATELASADKADDADEEPLPETTEVSDQEPSLSLDVLRKCVLREGLTSSDKPLKLLATLKRDGLARKEGAHVVLTLDGGDSNSMSIVDFQRTARSVLDEVPPVEPPP
jgi:hypothetical protein